MSVVFFDFLNNKQMSQNLSTLMNADFVEYEHRIFPDGESYFNIQSGVENKTVVILTSLLAPNNKILDLVFIAKTLRELGANDIGIVSPYLGYMRQDKKFKAGEALTSKIFAELLSAHFNWLITVDPHLHRYKALNEIYSIQTITLHAKDLLAEWIELNDYNAYLIGPDEESEQWVRSVAELAEVNFSVAKKQRFGDESVEISFPKLSAPTTASIILVDDIISSGYTMLESVKSLKKMGYGNISCLAIHGIFANNIDKKLIQVGVKNIITTNSILHQSNQIDLSDLIYKAIKEIIS